MKSLFLILAVLFALNTKVYSIDWEDYIDNPPCSTTPYSVDWGEPIEYKYCLNQPCSTCCFTVVYYDRWIGNPNFTNEIFIAGIFNDGNFCCSVYSDQSILTEFLKKIFYDKSKDNSDFYDKVSTVDNNILLSVKGRCLINEENCGSTCCNTPIKLNFGEANNNYYTVTSINYPPPNSTVNLPPCSPNQIGCNPNCNLPQKGINPQPCPVPCDQGNWSEVKSAVINLVECPGCQINLKYQLRYTVGCSPYEYYDYRLIDWERVNCDNCSLNEFDYYGSIVSWLLYNGGLPLPPTPNPCYENYRIVNSLCWRFIQENINGVNHVRAISCDQTICCIKNYKICKEWDSNLGIWRHRWYDISPQTQYEQCITPCIKLCSPIPN